MAKRKGREEKGGKGKGNERELKEGKRFAKVSEAVKKVGRQIYQKH